MASMDANMVGAAVEWRRQLDLGPELELEFGTCRRQGRDAGQTPGRRHAGGSSQRCLASRQAPAIERGRFLPVAPTLACLASMGPRQKKKIMSMGQTPPQRSFHPSPCLPPTPALLSCTVHRPNLQGLPSTTPTPPSSWGGKDVWPPRAATTKSPPIFWAFFQRHDTEGQARNCLANPPSVSTVLQQISWRSR